MATQNDVRQLALALPGAREEPGRFAFFVDNKGKAKQFAWVWKERIEPKKPRVPNPAVLAVRVANEIEKAALLGADPDKFFTEPHYNGFPAVLVRLKNVTKPELRRLLAEAWRCQAPKDAVASATPPRARASRRSPARTRGSSTSSARPGSSRRSPAARQRPR